MYGGGGGDNEVKETAEERALAEVAAKEWNWSKEHIDPLVDQYIADIPATSEDYARARGEAARAGRQAYSEAAETYTKTQGANPGSGAWKGGISGLAEDEAAAVGSAGAKAHYGVRQDQDRKKLAMLQYGSGKAATAMNGLGREASEAAGEAISSARRDFQEQGAWQQAAGTAAGIGLRAYEQPSSGKIGRYGVSGNNLPEENINAGTWDNPNL